MMRWYLYTFYRIDPDLPLGILEQQGLLLRSWLRSYASWRVLLLYGLILLPSFGLLAAAIVWWQRGDINWLLAIGLMFVSLAFGLAGELFVCRRIIAPAIRERLGQLGYILCHTCGYWLRGREDAERCPECGAHVHNN